MADTITLWTPVTIDLKAERDRINTPRLFNKNQRKVLLKIVDMFEVGDMRGLLEYVEDTKNEALFEYPIWEYVCEGIYDVIRNMNYFGKTYKLGEDIK